MPCPARGPGRRSSAGAATCSRCRPGPAGTIRCAPLAAVRTWGLDILCQDAREYSNVLTAVVMPDGHDADALRATILDRYDMSLGTGLARLKGRVFRIGHLGDFNDLTLLGTLAGVEMGLYDAGVPHRQGGVAAAMDVLAGRDAKAAAKAA